MEWICLECLTEHEVDSVTELRSYLVKDTEITIESEHAYCPICGAEMCNDEVTDKNLEAVYSKYRILKGE